MDRKRRSGLVGGLILILLGVWFLAMQWSPALQIWFSWPWFVIGAGMFLLMIGLLTGVPELAIPACIVGGIGGLLYWQNAAGNWESWRYAWTLIPGFVGAGVFLSGLLGHEPRKSMSEGINLILVSLALFVVFSAFMGGPNLLGDYWPALLILWGVYLLIKSLFRSRRA
jgi:hypothetical protein